MKYLFFLWAFLGMHSLFAQTKPFFETMIYVHDTLGNRDSVRIGYDLDVVNNDTSIFHDIIDNSPFDTILDMRVAIAVLGAWHPNGGPNLFKRLITPAETEANSPCTTGASIIFWIYAKHKPVTLTWNQSVFAADFCIEDAFFSPNKRYLISNPIPIIEAGGTVYACASKSDSLVWGLHRGFFAVDYPGVMNYNAIRELKGGEIDTIAGIFLDYPPGSYYSPCRIPTSVDDGASGFLPEASAAIWPNPGTEVLSVENHRWQEISAVRFFDLSGRLVWEKQASIVSGNTASFPVANLVTGMYMVQLTWTDGYTTTQKWVVGADAR